MAMLKKMRENKKKGFTLVELIVVLVILAILAALLIPALTGYIDKARNKSVVAETRQCVMAAQTLADEAYSKADETGKTKITVEAADVLELAELKEGLANDGITIDANGKVKTLVYNSGTKTCTYTAGATDGTDGAYNVTAKQ